MRVEVRYFAPANSRLTDILRLLRSATWVAFMTRHITPRLEKVSPTEAAVIDQLDRLSTRVHCDECAICMETSDESKDAVDRQAIGLPCGHAFHRDCIAPWLQVQSTCPVCRWQLPKAFKGRYAVRELSSVVLLDDDLAAVPRHQLPLTRVENRYVRTVVTVLLVKLSHAGLADEKPCAVSAHMSDARTGEVFSELNDWRNVASAPQRSTIPQWKSPDANAQCGSHLLTRLPPLSSVLAGRRKRQSSCGSDGEMDCHVVAKRRRSN